MEKFFVAVIAAIMLAAPVTAATVPSGATVCEHEGNGIAPIGGCDLTIADLGQTATQTVSFAGDGQLYGFVRDLNNTGLYADVGTIELGKDSMVSLALSNWSSFIDATYSLTQGATTVASGVIDSSTPFVNLGTFAAGSYVFSLDAAGGNDGSGNLTTNWAANISAIPLPAGAWLLLSGLGALGVARRRKSMSPAAAA